MNLSIFFEPVAEELASIESNYAFGSLIRCFTSKFPDWRQAQIALLGVNEWRGSLAEPPEENPADVIRRHLYSLKQGTTAELNIIDMGNLRPGVTAEETYL
ncbi:MAG: formiminoglutamase, partial [Chitinophagaceae bacterium]